MPAPDVRSGGQNGHRLPGTEVPTYSCPVREGVREPVVIAILRTLGRVFTGFILACLAAGLVQVLFVETPKELAALPTSEVGAQARGALELTLLTATHFAIFSAAFALIAAGIAEWLNLRNPGYWLAAGTGIALLGFTAQYASEISGQPSILNNYALQAYLTAGFFGGLVYWLVAGSSSGSGRLQDAGGVTPDAAEAARPRIIVEDAPAPAMKKGSLAEKLALKRGGTPAAADAAPQPRSTHAAATPSPSAAEKVSPSNKDASKPQVQGAATAVPVTRSEPSAKIAKGPAPQPNPAAKDTATPAKSS